MNMCANCLRNIWLGAETERQICSHEIEFERQCVNLRVCECVSSPLPKAGGVRDPRGC